RTQEGDTQIVVATGEGIARRTEITDVKAVPGALPFEPEPDTGEVAIPEEVRAGREAVGGGTPWGAEPPPGVQVGSGQRAGDDGGHLRGRGAGEVAGAPGEPPRRGAPHPRQAAPPRRGAGSSARRRARGRAPDARGWPRSRSPSRGPDRARASLSRGA